MKNQSEFIDSLPMILSSWPHIALLLEQPQGLQPQILQQDTTRFKAEFPRAAAVSLVLVMFCLLLMVFGIQVVFTVLKNPTLPDHGPGSFGWLSLYFLANSLFWIQIAIYFYGWEEIIIYQDHALIRMGIASFSISRVVRPDQILAASLRPGILAAQTIHLLIADSNRHQEYHFGWLFEGEQAREACLKLKNLCLDGRTSPGKETRSDGF